MTSIQQAFATIIEDCHPDALVSCGTTAANLADAWQRQHDGCHHYRLDSAHPNDGFPLPGTADLALVCDTLEHHPQTTGELLLGQLRNYGTHRIVVAAGDDWPFREFIALGFQRQGLVNDGDRELTLYSYNLDHYNPRRRWNNPDHWANPHMWDKARW